MHIGSNIKFHDRSVMQVQRVLWKTSLFCLVCLTLLIYTSKIRYEKKHDSHPFV